MYGALYLSLALPAPCRGVVGAVDRGNIAVFVCVPVGTPDHVCALEAHLALRLEPEVLVGGVAVEVLPLYVKLPAEAYLALACGAVGQVLHLHLLGFAFRPVLHDELQGVEYGHHAGGVGVKVLPYAVFEHGCLNHGIRLGHAYPIQEVQYGLRGISPAPERAQGRHAGVVPAGDVLFLHQPAEVALAHYGIGHVQPGELYLPRLVLEFALLYDPVIQRPVGLVLKGAEGVGNALYCVLYGMGEVVHGVDAPLVPLMVMGHVYYPVHGGIAHVEVGGGHVYLGAQRPAAVREFAVLHALEQVQVFFDAPVPPGGVPARLGKGSPVFPHLVL